MNVRKYIIILFVSTFLDRYNALNLKSSYSSTKKLLKSCDFRYII